jgi:hypothetical protein
MYRCGTMIEIEVKMYVRNLANKPSQQAPVFSNEN